jgi:hypothetical protein
LRWTFWLIPLWLVSTIPALDALANRMSGRSLALALLAVSTFSAWYPIENPWQHPWLFQVLDRWHWIDYRHPVEPFSRPVVTFFPLLPEQGEWIDFEGIEPGGEVLRLRLADGGVQTEQERQLRKVNATWNRGTKRERTLSFMIDPAAFYAGKSPADFVASETTPDGETKDQAAAFLLGLPTIRPYRRDGVRYLKAPLRHDAFTSRKAAAQVAVDDPKSGRAYVHRIEVWVTAAVPFGVLQIEQTVRDDETDELISARRLTAVAASRSRPEQATDAKTAEESEASGLNIPAK